MIAFLVGLLMCLSPLTAGISDTGVSYTSSNWAGYVQEGSYTMVSAHWTVPALVAELRAAREVVEAAQTVATLRPASPRREALNRLEDALAAYRAVVGETDDPR